jgi:hypothetical protein
MSHDGLPTRARHGAREADADRPRRRSGVGSLAALGAAAIVILAACGSTSSSSGVAGATGTPLTSASTGASTEASASASGGLSQGFMTFQEENASKVFGGGTVTDLGDGSSAVTLGIVAVGFEDALPARLVAGACTEAASAPPPSFELPSAEPSGGASAAASAAPSAAPSVAPSASAGGSAGASLPAESTAPSPATLPIDLTPVSGGGSNTVVQIALADLLASPSSVLVYKSAADPTLVACADVTAQLTIPSSAPSGGGLESASPSAAESMAASGSTAP